jgi:hypothetical protein
MIMTKLSVMLNAVKHLLYIWRSPNPDSYRNGTDLHFDQGDVFDNPLGWEISLEIRKLSYKN